MLFKDLNIKIGTRLDSKYLDNYYLIVVKIVNDGKFAICRAYIDNKKQNKLINLYILAVPDYWNVKNINKKPLFDFFKTR